MLSRLPAPLVGIISFSLYAGNLIFWVLLLHLVALCHWLMPYAPWRQKLCQFKHKLPLLYADGNSVIMNLTTHIEWDIVGAAELTANDWYLIISNHQSWADILILLKVFNRKIPSFKFFTKKPLLWMPFVGVACWLLDFPFMYRYSKESLEKNPHLKNRDIETTQRFCEKFKDHPISVVSFVEGTRFTALKHQRQQSPYKYLLRPRAGGIAFVIAAMEKYLQHIIDVTISYHCPQVHAWDFFCGKIKKISIQIKVIPLSKDLVGDYQGDPEFRYHFQQWLNHLWQEKDQKIAEHRQ